ncbi:STAS domain-containing protein [Geodermatophilus sp. SYSU D00697]
MRRLPGAATVLVELDPVGGRLLLAGQLDRRTTHLLHAAVSALLEGGCTHWTVEVSDLTVADHAALRAIGAAYRRATRHGRRLTILGTSPALHGALTRLRLDRHVLAPEDPVPPLAVPA